MSRISQARLERALGGASVLVQLTDVGHTGTADATTVTEILDEAEAEMNSALRTQISLTDPSLVTDPVVLRYQTAIARHLAYTKGTGALAEPDDSAKEYDLAQQWLTQFARRERGLGGEQQGASSQQVEQITREDDEPFFSTSSPRARFNGWA